MSHDTLIARVAAADPAFDAMPDSDATEALLRELLAIPPTAEASRRGRRSVIHRLRQASLFAQVAWLAVSLSALGGVATGAYLAIFGGGTPARQLSSLECQRGNIDAVVQTITGDPVVDCATVWRELTGQATAPPLAAWTSPYGGVAVVRPASAGAPANGSGWQRLPRGWTVDLTVVELTDQLNDISAGLADGTSCTYPTVAVDLARSLLATDRLRGWKVTLHANNGSLNSGCRAIATNVDAAARTIQLIQIQATHGPIHTRSLLNGRVLEYQPAHSSPLTQRRVKEYLRVLGILLRVEAHVNQALSARCSTVTQAAALWIRDGGSAGLQPATPAFWRAIHNGDRPGSLPANFDSRYTLYKQPASQRTGRCARILVQDDGGDNLTVYAARMQPNPADR